MAAVCQYGIRDGIRVDHRRSEDAARAHRRPLRRIYAVQPAAHSVRIDPGTCAEWMFTWTQVDAAGRTVPAGDYQLQVDFLTPGLTRLTSTFTIS